MDSSQKYAFYQNLPFSSPAGDAAKFGSETQNRYICRRRVLNSGSVSGKTGRDKAGVLLHTDGSRQHRLRQYGFPAVLPERSPEGRRLYQ